LKKDSRKNLDKKAGSLALFLAILWSGNPVGTKLGLLDTSPLRLGWMRFVAGAVIVLIYSLLTKKSFRIKNREYLPLFTLGILFSIQLIFLNVGQSYTPASHAVLIFTTYPLWAGIVAHFVVPGDKLTRYRIIGVIVAYSGIIVVFINNFSNSSYDYILGDFLCLICAILLAIRQIFISNLGQTIEQHKMLASQAIFGIIIFFVGSYIFESPTNSFFTKNIIISVVYTGIIIAGFAFMAQHWLLRTYLPSRVIFISLSQPIFGVLLSWIILGENIGIELYIGSILVIIGSAIAQTKNKSS